MNNYKPLRNNFWLGILLTISLSSLYTVANAQQDTTNGKYKRYIDKEHQFSLSLPVEWQIIKDEELPDMAFPVKKDTANSGNYENEIFTIVVWGEGICDSLFLWSQGFSEFFYCQPKDWSSEK